MNVRREEYSFSDGMVFPFGFVIRDGEVSVSSCDFADGEISVLESTPDLLGEDYLAHLDTVFSAMADENGYDCEIVRCIEYSLSDRNAIDTSLVLDGSEVLTEDNGYEYLTEGRPDDDGGDPLAFVTVSDGKVLSYAYENPDLSGDGTSDIAVETAEEYRGRGYGTSNVAALAYYLLDPGRTVTYTAEYGNLPSRKIAEKVGFTHSADEVRVIWYKKGEYDAL